MNALLKTLEEPTPNTLIMLVSHKPERLPATIRSRCQSINIKVNQKQAEVWLSQNLAHLSQDELAKILSRYWDAPLRVIEESGLDVINLSDTVLKDLVRLSCQSIDPVTVAASWDVKAQQTILNILMLWIIDLIRVSFGATDKLLYSPWQFQYLQMLSEQIDLRRLYGYLDDLYASERQLTHNPNPQLVFEHLLVHWQTISTKT